MNITERFLKYISIDTVSDSKKNDTPSTKNQLIFAKELIKELKELNMDRIDFDEKNCYVYSCLKGEKIYLK